MPRMFKCLICLAPLLLLPCGGVTGAEKDAAVRQFITGVDTNYLLEMERLGRTWSSPFDPAGGGDPVVLLGRAGCDGMRVRLFTGDGGNNGLHNATEVARRAKRAGLAPYLVVFLSEDWSDYVKQPAPPAWRDLDLDAKCRAVEAYAERVARHFTDAGVPIDLFEIGNEIDYGICGEFEEEWPKRVSTDYMRLHRWPRMAQVIRAAQAGVRKARPQARFTLHLAQWHNPEYCTAFWRYMLEQGVAVDVLGLSYFPTSAADEKQRPIAFLDRTVDALSKALDRPVMICETAHPSAPQFAGQFADWNKPVDGYALDEAGQAKWLADLLAWGRGKPNVTGIYYWSPEWYGTEPWEPFALFDRAGKARPAVRSFAPPAAR